IPAGEVCETPAGGDPSPAPALLAADLPAGRLELHGRHRDPALTACFALAVRDLADGRSRAAAGGEPPVPGSNDSNASDAGEDSEAPEEIRPRGPATSLVGSSPSLRAAVARLARVATADIPVLIRGESGTGKELAAREIHRASTRAHGPFVAVNCAALAESLQLSDLFGHVRGAFTGADRDRVGVFEAAR